MKIVNADQMRHIDEVTIRERGIPGFTLMERAGKAVAREIMDRFAPASVAVVAGKGNNGGDGFITAAALHRRGVSTRVFTTFDPSEAKGDAKTAFEALPPEVQVEQLARGDEAREKLAPFEIVVDALLGTGQKGPARGLAAEVINAINKVGDLVVSIDIPSGLLAEAAQTDGPRVRAHLTVTIGLPKFGLVVEPGVRDSGIVSVAEIGFPADLLESDEINSHLLGPTEMSAALPPRDPAGHKGTFGRVLILGGSVGMTGAAILAARAAVRSGAGLVYSAYPEALGPVMETNLIEPVKIPLSGEGRWFSAEHAPACIEAARTAEAVALGPGVGQREATAQFVDSIITGIEAPLVIDADGLNLVVGKFDALQARPNPTILTPHPAEAARLLGVPTNEIQSDRVAAATKLAELSGAIIALKGAQTIIAEPSGAIYINPTGNTGLAKGGSGDVLTGLIAGLAAQCITSSLAVRLGVFTHGLAADLASAEIGMRAMTPSDVIEHLGKAFLCLERGES